MSSTRPTNTIQQRSVVLIVVFATMLGAAALFSSPLNALFGTRIVQSLDRAAWVCAHALSSPAVVVCALIVSNVHGTVGILILTTLVAWALKLCGRADGSVRLLLAVPGVMVLNALAKLAIHRLRPEWAMVELPGSFSFPSGHVAEATAFYGALVLEAASLNLCRLNQAALALGATAMVCIVAASRIALGVHFLSDCIGAVVEGSLWLAACFQDRLALSLRAPGHLR